MNAAIIAAQTAARKRAALANLQNAKHEARERADDLYEKRGEMKQAATLRAEEREVVSNHPFDLFPTPSDLAERMVRIAEEVFPGCDNPNWLEPEAGTGRIADAIRSAGYTPICIEWNMSAAQLLEKRGYTVLCDDFLKRNIEAGIVVMNPPFSNGQDIKHVRHAYDCLCPGGRIVAIMSEGAFYRSDRAALEFQEWFKQVGTHSERLPAGTFKASGTMVTARLVVIDKEK